MAWVIVTTPTYIEVTGKLVKWRNATVTLLKSESDREGQVQNETDERTLAAGERLYVTSGQIWRE